MAPLYSSPQDSPYTFERITAAERDRRLRDLDKLFGPGQGESLEIGPEPKGDSLRPGTFGSSRGRPGTFQSRNDGGPAGGTQPMSHSQAAAAHSVEDTSMASNVTGMLPKIGTLSTAAVEGLNAVAGPYGVVGGPISPQVGTPAFAQQTPVKDTPPGVPDAGAQAAAGSNFDISPQAAFGGQPAPVPDTFGFDPFGGITDGLFGGDESFGGVAANTPRGGGNSGSRGGLQGFADRGFGTQGLGGLGGGGGNDSGGSPAGSGGSGATGPDGPAGNGMGAF